MKYFAAITLLIFLAGCRQENVLQSNLLVTGHGGAGFDTYRNQVPPNTLEAMHRGYFVEGADALEMDVQLTRDSVLVLFHDQELDANTACKGCVSSYSFGEISACRIETRNGPVNGNFTVPSLEEVILLLKPTDAVLFLNVKSHDPCVRDSLDSYYGKFARALSRLIGAHNLYNRVFVETYDLNFLLSVRAADSSFRFIFDHEDFEFAKSTALSNQFSGFAITNNQATAEQVLEAKNQNLMVILWGVRILSASKEAVAKKPDAIMTDDIRMLRQIVDE